MKKKIHVLNTSTDKASENNKVSIINGDLGENGQKLKLTFHQFFFNTFTTNKQFFKIFF